MTENVGNEQLSWWAIIWDFNENKVSKWQKSHEIFCLHIKYETFGKKNGFI